MWKLFTYKIIRALGGFPTVDDAIDAIQEKGLEERKKILTLAVRRLYNTIGADDILRETPEGQWILEGKQMPDAVRKLVSAEAKQLIESRLWDVLQRDVKYQANRRMFLIGTTETDIVAGKLWSYTLDAFSTRLASLARGKGSFNTKEPG